jgi:CelD/BcsL family acetyltransferase involved in cellulose biosynthesis
MELTVAYQASADVPVAVRGAGAIARVEIFDELAAAEPCWRELETGGALLTPYQRHDLLAAWQRHVGARDGVRPFLIAGFDGAGAPMFLWPLGCRNVGPLRVLNFLGSKHANFNIALWRRDAAASIGAGEIVDVFRSAAKTHGIDLAALFSQPLIWNGTINPFARLPHQASAEVNMRASIPRATRDALAAVLTPSMRARLRGKEKKLEKLAGYRYFQATTDAEIDRLLDSFFAMKSTRMDAQGVANVFAEPGVADFLREACHRRIAGGRPVIELHALEAGGEVLALYGSLVDDYRFSSMFNTIATGESARHSPGLVLLTHMLVDCNARGARSFDLGVGRAHYKTFFCRELEPLVDVFLPLTLRGRLAAQACSLGFAIKRLIKEQPTLWAGVQTLRRWRARSSLD